jgi:hypothetical protein
MKKTLLLIMNGFLGALMLTACNSTSDSTLPTPAPSPSPQPSAEIRSLPTPSASGQEAVYGDLQVVMIEAEITTSYLNEYGSNREPSAGMEILWIHFSLKNIGLETLDLPEPEHFSALSSEAEYKSTYGHRLDHADYLALTTGLEPGQEVDAWLRFDVPAALELKDLMFVFMPESLQISVGFSSSAYPWGDQPLYLWTCAQ